MTRIAVVDDDAVFLDMMSAVLTERGWEVSIHRESERAFAALRNDPPDLIILDIRMAAPESGWTLLELFTLDAGLSDVPIIVCSAAMEDLQRHEEWLASNGIPILPKPFNIDQLYEMVENALQKRPV